MFLLSFSFNWVADALGAKRGASRLSKLSTPPSRQTKASPLVKVRLLLSVLPELLDAPSAQSISLPRLLQRHPIL